MPTQISLSLTQHENSKIFLKRSNKLIKKEEAMQVLLYIRSIIVVVWIVQYNCHFSFNGQDCPSNIHMM